MYLFLDFETTWLDLYRDEPIQIWLLLVDNNWNIMRSYSSLIKPERSIDQLKTVVSHITGLTIDDIINAPSRALVCKEISDLFIDNPLIIGHNIWFDIHFLQKFFPTITTSISSICSIDTFTLSQYLIHYATSYSLESLIDVITTTNQYTNNSDTDTDSYDYHNALEDCKASMKLAYYLEQHLQLLSKQYGINISTIYTDPNNNVIKNLTHQSSSILQILSHIEKKWYDHTTYNTCQIIKPLPPLQKPVEKNSIDLYNQQDSIVSIWSLKNHSQCFVGHTAPQEVFLDIVKPYLTSPSSPVILATSAKQKVTAIKKILQSHGIYNIWFGKQEQYFDQSKRAYFQHKNTYTLHEILFIYSYCSHHHQWLSVLHLCNQEQYSIFDFLSLSKDQISYPISLFSHHGLFHWLKESHPCHHIIFLDPERRYKSFNSYQNNPFDWYHIIQFWENCLYAINLSRYDGFEDINKIRLYMSWFVWRIQVLVWLCWIETTRLFVGTSETKRTIDPMIANSDFRMTMSARVQITKWWNYIESLPCREPTQRSLMKQRRNMINDISNTIIVAEKKIYNTQLYYTYQTAVNYTSFPEFLEQFNNHHTIFLSTIDPNKSWYNNQHISTFKTRIQYEQTNDLQKVLAYIKEHIRNNVTRIVIMSDSALRAKQVFEKLHKQTYASQYSVYAENATWWTQKILTQLSKHKKNWPLIIIGWYQFLLSVCTQWVIMPADMMVYSYSSQFVQQMIGDISRWSSTTRYQSE